MTVRIYVLEKAIQNAKAMQLLKASNSDTCSDFTESYVKEVIEIGIITSDSGWCADEAQGFMGIDGLIYFVQDQIQVAIMGSLEIEEFEKIHEQRRLMKQ